MQYSYTKYDALGRIREVRQLDDYTYVDEASLQVAIADSDFPQENAYQTSEVVKTYYDKAIDGFQQDNLRNRVSKTVEMLTPAEEEAYNIVNLHLTATTKEAVKNDYQLDREYKGRCVLIRQSFF